MSGAAVLVVWLSSMTALADTREHGFQKSRLTLLAQADAAGCSKDIDCKGERICIAGACQDPAPRAPSTVDRLPPPPPPASPGVSRSGLDDQMLLLEQSRPSYVGSTVLIVLGSLITVPGLVIFFFVSWPAGLVMMLVGAIPLAIGIAIANSNATQERSIDLQLQQLRDQKRALEYRGEAAPSPSLRVARF